MVKRRTTERTAALDAEANAEPLELSEAEQARLDAKPARTNEAARRFAIESARLLSDDRCEEIVILDLCGISPICDYFVIATGTSDRQMRAVADSLKQMGKRAGDPPFAIDGLTDGQWIIVDFVDVIVHLFDDEKRGYYDLDSLWGDAPQVDWQVAPPPEAAAS